MRARRGYDANENEIKNKKKNKSDGERMHGFFILFYFFLNVV
jgi:hypothetical protein